MIQNPLISIIIPAYNAEKFIAKTLDSVLAQTYKNYELIVVDDGSSDKTAEVVEEYLKKNDMHGMCIRQQNKKIAGARNTGIRAASGPWIALLDHDDLWFPQKLEEVIKELNRHPDVDLICHNEIVTERDNTRRISRNGPNSVNMYESLLFSGNCLSPSATLFKKNVALKSEGFHEDPAYNTVEDYDFWLRISRIAKFHFLNQTLGEYVLVKTAASRNIIYHHTNMEIMLRSHLDKYLSGKMGIRMKFKAQKRLAVVYRSCLSQLMSYKENVSAQKDMARKMISTCPWDWKNIVQFVRCVICS